MTLENSNKYIFLLLSCFLISVTAFSQKQVAITMDDPNTKESATLNWQQRDEAILGILFRHHIKAALFVCGMRVDSAAGRKLLAGWDKAGHLICNHSYSHLYFGKSTSAVKFIADFKKGDSIISQYKNYTKLFRFPYLKEGNTSDKADSMRAALKSTGYRNGQVSIDASDWYIDAEMTKALKANPQTDLSPYRDYYVQHILDRAHYYDSLSQRVWQKPVKHTLLVHHSLLNALFLDDVIQALEKQGWTFVDAIYAFADPLYLQQPRIIPAGESIIWQLAKQDTRFSGRLRYPAEDGEYEKEPLAEAVRKYALRKK